MEILLRLSVMSRLSKPPNDPIIPFRYRINYVKLYTFSGELPLWSRLIPSGLADSPSTLLGTSLAMTGMEGKWLTTVNFYLIILGELLRTLP